MVENVKLVEAMEAEAKTREAVQRETEEFLRAKLESQELELNRLRRREYEASVGEVRACV